MSGFCRRVTASSLATRMKRAARTPSPVSSATTGLPRSIRPTIDHARRLVFKLKFRRHVDRRPIVLYRFGLRPRRPHQPVELIDGAVVGPYAAVDAGEE